MQWLLDNIVCYFRTALHLAINAVVTAVGALWATIVALLPNMPGQPSVPDIVQTGIGYAYYICDVGWLLAFLATFWSIFGAVLLVMIPLRWIKAAD